MSTFGTKIDFMKQYLSMRDAVHQVIASNIANAETPEYTAKLPSFSFKLDQQANQNKTEGLLGVEKSPMEIGMKILDSNADPRENGNNVNVNQELAAMSENSMLYMGALKILNKELAITKYAINNIG